MSNSQIQRLTAAGYSEPITINLSTFQDGIGLVVAISDGGSATYTVECTGDRVDTAAALKLWVPLPLLTAKTTSLTSNLEYPVTAIRLNASFVNGILQLAVVNAS